MSTNANRPAGNGAIQSSAGGPNTPILDGAAVIRGAFVTVVRLPADKYRRRVFLTLAAAERAARRALANGHQAEVVLCRLVPVNDPEDLFEGVTR